MRYEAISMINLRLPITVACAVLLASGMAVAGEIYKWTDADGYVHYEDRPIGKTDMQHVDIISRNTDNSVVQARLDADREARATARQVASEAPRSIRHSGHRPDHDFRLGVCHQLYRLVRAQEGRWHSRL